MPAAAPLKIAVTAWRLERFNATALCRQAEQAEAMGFHSYWLPENHFGDQRSIPSPLTLLAAVAARTSRLKLATTSYLLPIRHPIQAAEEVAVLDQLSEGRLILGLGRGMPGPLFSAFGVDSRDKRTLFSKNLDTMIRAWRGQAIAETADATPVQLAPLPVQRPHPPLWVAAFGPLALQQAGALGLPYLGSPIETLEKLEANIACYRDAARDNGQVLEKTMPLMRVLFVSDNRQLNTRLKERLADSPLARARGEPAPVDDWAIIGDATYVGDRISEYRERLGLTHLIGGGRLPPMEEREQIKSHEALARATL